MARYAKVDVRIWDDDKVKALTPIPHCGQGLWIRLLVSRHRSPVPGLLCVGEAALAEEFGWTLEDFRKAFAEAKREGLVKADWKARVVWLPKAWKYNSPESPNVVRSWRIPWDETPECALKWEIYQTLKAFVEGFKEGFKKAFAQACRMPSPNQEQEPEQDPEQEDLSLRDPGTQNVNCKSAYDWMAYFKAKYWETKGRQYGQGSADAKALASFGDLLASLPVDQRATDWLARERIVIEFLSRTDPKTVQDGWPFCFFANVFRGLALPPEKRPKIDAKPTQRPQDEPVFWNKA
jgi:hypothetical protein